MLNDGDIVWIDFDPAFGHEQAGRRPALVISKHDYNSTSSFVLMCPITRNEKSWPFKLRLPNESKVVGLVLADQIKAVDKRRIVSKAIAVTGADFMVHIPALLKPLLGIIDQKQ